MNKLLMPALIVIASSAIAHNLVDIQEVCPSICTDIRYATTNNFVGHAVYPVAKCYVLKHVAEALTKVQQNLTAHGLSLKIYDGFRPFSAQEKFWEFCPDERFVSNPKKGGRHTRGTAVDVTLIRLSDGAELHMPTEFDNMTEQAFRSSFKALPEDSVARKNCQLLEDVMTQHGFIGFTTEWWHFDFQGWEHEEPIRLSFEDLE